MMSEFNTLIYVLNNLLSYVRSDGALFFLLLPMLVIYEMPLFLLIISGILRFYYQEFMAKKAVSLYMPKVSVVITCYAEGDAVKSTILSFVEQVYQGEIEIIVVIDGAVQNAATYVAAKQIVQSVKHPKRKIIVLPKWQRGGRVSTLNAGLHIATGEIVVNVDADTSFDCDMLSHLIPYFEDEDIPAVGGSLRVRNVGDSMLTRMQAIEYLVSIQGGKTGLGQWNLLNNISGAFGAFRRKILLQMGGWDTHTAEDLDLTLRFKHYFKRYPHWRIPFATLAIGHTNVPVSVKDLILQRLRWDGDLLFLYFRKHWPTFTPKLLGTRTFIFTLLYGFLQNVLMSPIVILYMLWICIHYPWPSAVSTFVFLYLVYLAILIFMYLLVVLSVSERPKNDLKLAIWLPLYPFYSFFMRLVNLFALCNEILRRSHEESSMAPWWVLKRGRKF